MTRQKSFEPARAARIKRKYTTKYRAKDPLPCSPRRTYVKRMATWAPVYVVAAILAMALKYA